MSSPTLPPSGTPSEETPPVEPVPPASIPSSSDPHPRTNPIGWSTALAILVGVLAWGLGETRYLEYQAEITDVSMMGHAYRDASPETRRAAQLKTVRARSVLLGALVGLGAGLAGGLARRRARAALIGGASGLIVGGLLAGLFVVPLMLVYLRAEDQSAGELSRSILLHLGLWLPIGAAAGISLVLGLGTPGRALAAILGGLLGVTLGTIGYEVLGSMLYPLAETGAPVAVEWQPRLLAALLVALGAASGAAAASSSEAKPGPAAATRQAPA